MRVLDHVAALNLSLVMAHQTDAAYWREWEMFGLPGGIQFFTFFNWIAFMFLLWLFAELVSRKRTALRASFLIAALSMIGLPPTIGFVSKWFMLSGAMSASSTFGSSVAVTAIVISTLLNAAYFLPIVYHAFFSDERISDSQLKTHEAVRGHEDMHGHAEIPSHGDAPLSMRIALIVTAGLTLLLFFLADSLLSLASGMN